MFQVAAAAKIMSNKEDKLESAAPLGPGARPGAAAGAPEVSSTFFARTDSRRLAANRDGPAGRDLAAQQVCRRRRNGIASLAPTSK